MANKITSETISRMVELYDELGTYNGVAKALGVSASTVSKYLKQQNSLKTFSTYNGPAPSENPPEKNLILGFSFLSTTEKQSYNEFLEELGYVL